jgi:hypothetical protein
MVGMTWRKSRLSFSNGNCVEVAGNWRKSSASMSDGHCAEVAALPAGTVAVRDTTDREGPVLRFGAEAWRAFAARVKLAGELP